jgi:hypothetical protein
VKGFFANLHFPVISDSWNFKQMFMRVFANRLLGLRICDVLRAGSGSGSPDLT